MRFVVPDTRSTLRPGTYRAVLTGVELRENERGRFLRWLFEVRTRTGSALVTGTTSTKFGAGAKARAWVEALLNRPLAPGEELDSDELVGLPCYVVVRERTTADGTMLPTVEQVSPVGDEE
jgi:hypothetical protein